jgi:anti-sigma B factor antagonist
MTPPVDRSVVHVRMGLHQEVLISFAGDLDVATAENLRSAADEAWQARPSSIVVDLAGMTFCDSVGVGALIYILKGCTQRGTRLALAGANSRTRRLLRITGLLTQFESIPPSG